MDVCDITGARYNFIIEPVFSLGNPKCVGNIILKYGLATSFFLTHIAFYKCSKPYGCHAVFYKNNFILITEILNFKNCYC